MKTPTALFRSSRGPVAAPTVRFDATTAKASSGRSEYLRGAADMFPLAAGYIPFALLVGAAVARSSGPLAAWAVTPLIYGGSAHLSVIEMLRSGSGLWAAAGAALLVNVRLLVYSSELIPLWASATIRARLLAAAMVVDPTWMMANRRARQGGTVDDRQRHFVGAATVMALLWFIAVTVGTLLGSDARIAAILAVGVPLCLVTLVAPHLRLPGGLAAVAAATVVTIGTSSWPPGSGTLLAMAAAAVCGGLLTGRSR